MKTVDRGEGRGGGHVFRQGLKKKSSESDGKDSSIVSSMEKKKALTGDPNVGF